MDDSLLGMFVMIGRQRGFFVSMCLREAIFSVADNVFGEQEKRKTFTFFVTASREDRYPAKNHVEAVCTSRAFTRINRQGEGIRMPRMQHLQQLRNRYQRLQRARKTSDALCG